MPCGIGIFLFFLLFFNKMWSKNVEYLDYAVYIFKPPISHQQEGELKNQKFIYSTLRLQEKSLAQMTPCTINWWELLLSMYS